MRNYLISHLDIEHERFFLSTIIRGGIRGVVSKPGIFTVSLRDIKTARTFETYHEAISYLNKNLVADEHDWQVVSAFDILLEVIDNM